MRYVSWLAGALVCVAAGGSSARAQPGTQEPRGRIVVPSLARVAPSGDLEFQGGACEADGVGTLDCVFQQVFLTVALFDAQTCLVTMNRYGRTFHQQAAGRWVSREAPEGECGVVDEATLEHGGGTRWKLEFRKLVEKPGAAAACQTIETTAEVLSWENVRRPVPCRFVQPGELVP